MALSSPSSVFTYSVNYSATRRRDSTIIASVNVYHHVVAPRHTVGLAGQRGERGANYLSLNPGNDDCHIRHLVVLSRATKHNSIALTNVTANTVAGPEADPTRGERRDRDRIEGLVGVEGIQQARELD